MPRAVWRGLPLWGEGSPAWACRKSPLSWIAKSLGEFTLVKWKSCSFAPTIKLVRTPTAWSANMRTPWSSTGPTKPTGTVVTFATSSGEAKVSSWRPKCRWILISFAWWSPRIKTAVTSLLPVWYNRVLTTRHEGIFSNALTSSTDLAWGVETFSKGFWASELSSGGGTTSARSTFAA